MNEILRNFSHCKEFSDDSFVGCWHEDASLNMQEYWKFDREIYELASVYSGEDIPRRVAWPLARIFSYIMMSIQGHYSSNGGFYIENLDDIQMSDFRERFQLVVEGFFKGEMPNNTHFELVNPLLNTNT
ncbi:Imm41 family immunity protein [Neptuniibacter sp. QD72_48]|uniref:Imm41 family immunity protein n=1 Tax=Neptuniibacter sp. QD72_48 TaxID=3398214 RepID=UPI0039F58875